MEATGTDQPTRIETPKLLWDALSSDPDGLRSYGEQNADAGSSGWIALARFASEHTVISLIGVVLALGVVFSLTNAIGLTNTDQEDPSRPATRTDQPANEPSASSPRAWLSPNQDGDDCRWMPGKASDYGDPWSFCNYSAP